MGGRFGINRARECQSPSDFSLARTVLFATRAANADQEEFHSRNPLIEDRLHLGQLVGVFSVLPLGMLKAFERFRPFRADPINFSGGGHMRFPRRNNNTRQRNASVP